jgi:hypothetical protein
MPALLRQDLVFDLDRIGTCPFQRPYRVIHIDHIAEASVCIDDDGQRYCFADDGRVSGNLVQSDKAEIRHSEPGITYAGASYVNGLIAQFLNEPRGQRISRAGQKHPAPRLNYVL